MMNGRVILLILALVPMMTATAIELKSLKGYYEYHEPNLMQITAKTIGIGAKHRIKLGGGLGLNLKGEYILLDANYLAHTNGAEVVGMNDNITKKEISLSKTVNTYGVSITPEIGKAQYNLNNYMYSSGVSNSLSVGTYDRHQVYNYTPRSIKIGSGNNAGNIFFIKYTDKGFDNGAINSKLTQLGLSSLPYDIKCSQINGDGSKLELGFERGDYAIIMYKDKWSIGDSEECSPIPGFVEPENYTIQSGLELSITF